MIKICYDAEKIRISAEGHAEYDIRGRDIVCAAVSAIMHSLAEYVSRHGDDYSDNPLIEVGDDYMIIQCCPISGEGEIRAAFEVCTLGLGCIARQYPDNVSIEKNKSAAGSLRH